jgi:hypothetical protein
VTSYQKTDFKFEPLGKQHNRAAFSCGVKALDLYFQGDPICQDMSRNLATAFVLTPDSNFVAGFYTLSSISIYGADLPPALTKRLPRRELGSTLIGRLGRDLSLHHQGIGDMLLGDALYRAWLASKLVSSMAVIVDVKECARDFYLEHEFIPFATQPTRFFYLMKNIDRMFEGKDAVR